MFSIWEIESQSALSSPCLPCCCPLTGLVWKDTGRSCSLLERACSFWIPRVGDLLLRTTESFWPSWVRPLGNCVARLLVSFQKLLGLLTGMVPCFPLPSAEPPLPQRTLLLSPALGTCFGVAFSVLFSCGCGVTTRAVLRGNLPELESSVSWKIEIKFLDCVWLWGQRGG